MTARQEAAEHWHIQSPGSPSLYEHGRGALHKNLTVINSAPPRAWRCESITGTARDRTVTELDVTVVLLSVLMLLKINQEDIPHLRLRRVLVCS